MNIASEAETDQADIFNGPVCAFSVGSTGSTSPIEEETETNDCVGIEPPLTATPAEVAKLAENPELAFLPTIIEPTEEFVGDIFLKPHAAPKTSFSTRAPRGRKQKTVSLGDIQPIVDDQDPIPAQMCPWALLEKVADEYRAKKDAHHQPPPHNGFGGECCPRQPLSSSPCAVARTGPPGKERGGEGSLTRQPSIRDGSGFSDGGSAIEGTSGLRALQRFHDKAQHRAQTGGSSSVTSASAEHSHQSSAGGKRRPRRRKPKNHQISRPPTFKAEEVKAHSPRLKRSWKLFIEKHSWRHLGSMVYEKLFAADSELDMSMFRSSLAVQGVKLIDMFNQMIEVVEDPRQIHERMCGLAEVHRARGVKIDDIPRMSKALMAVLEEVLQDNLTEKSRNAWAWFLQYINRSMALTLQEAKSQTSLIQLSWDIAVDNYTEEELGELVYETLMEIAPSMKSVVTQPKQVVAHSFVEMLQLLVFFAGEDEMMHAKMMGLAQRHFKYGVRTYHSPMMGQTIMAMLQAAVGEEWTADMAVAWQDHWDACCQAMNSRIVGWENHEAHASVLWERVQKRLSQRTFGEIVMRHLLASDPDFLWSFARAVKDAEQSGDDDASSADDHRDLNSPRASQEGEESEDGHSGGSWRKLKLFNPIFKLSGKHFGDQCKCHRHQGPGGAGSSFGRAASAPWGPEAFQTQHAGSIARQREGSDTEVASTQFTSITPRTLAQAAESFSMSLHKVPLKMNRQIAADAIGQELWKMMSEIVDVLFAPKRQTVTCICCSGGMFVLATRLFHLGMRVENLEEVGLGIEQALQSSLAEPCAECGLHEWKEEQSSAWEWLWGQWTATFKRVVEPLEAQENQLVRASWEIIKRTRTPSEIADSMYYNLVQEAPHTAGLFQRPKKMQEYSFTQSLEMITQFGEHPEAFFRELQPLIIRHVKYGVKADFLQPFGVAVLKTLEDLLGEFWDEKTRMAWKGNWARCSGCVSRHLSIGTNMITVALVNADLCKLQEALLCAPRGQRVSLLTSVDVNGTVMSPLYWAIRDGKFSIARYMLQDLLAIRADREAYYYGRRELWQTHPNLISVLCSEAPDMVDTVFDGLMWHSQTVLPLSEVQEGLVRVNYYIEELFSDPRQIEDVWQTPLAILTTHGSTAMFQHPVLIKVLDVKWAWMKKGFLLMQLLFGIQLLSYITCLELEDDREQLLLGLRWFSLLFASCMLCFFVKVIAEQVVRKQVFVKRIFGVKVEIPQILNSSWSVIRVVGMVLMIITTSVPLLHMDVEGSSVFTWYLHVRAWCGLLLFLQLTQLLIISTRLAALLHSVRQLLSHVTRNILLMGIVLFAFAVYLESIREPEFATFEQSSLNLLRIVLQLDEPSLMDVGPWGLFMMVLFIIIIQIGMVNIIIAQLALAYEDLSVDKGGHAKMNRAFVCLEVESLLSKSLRRSLFLQQRFDKPLEFDNGDKGPSGGVQFLEPAAVRAHPKYIPDRIVRSPGRASALDPWPKEEDWLVPAHQ